MQMTITITVEVNDFSIEEIEKALEIVDYKNDQLLEITCTDEDQAQVYEYLP